VKISRHTILHNPGQISIGSHVRIDDLCFISAGKEVRIGSYIHIAPNCILAGAQGIVMEDFSGLAARVTLQTATDDYSGGFLTNPAVPDEFRKITGGIITLKKHAVVGMHAVILPGITLGEGCAVGACSLVRDTVEDWSIVVGIPAKKIKDRSRNLLELERRLACH
jgi:acetyltransferase-like isoleucine patch superfamily enzyme